MARYSAFHDISVKKRSWMMHGYFATKRSELRMSFDSACLPRGHDARAEPERYFADARIHYREASCRHFELISSLLLAYRSRQGFIATSPLFRRFISFSLLAHYLSRVRMPARHYFSRLHDDELLSKNARRHGCYFLVAESNMKYFGQELCESFRMLMRAYRAALLAAKKRHSLA